MRQNSHVSAKYWVIIMKDKIGSRSPRLGLKTVSRFASDLSRTKRPTSRSRGSSVSVSSRQFRSRAHPCLFAKMIPTLSFRVVLIPSVKKWTLNREWWMMKDRIVLSTRLRNCLSIYSRTITKIWHVDGFNPLSMNVASASLDLRCPSLHLAVQ